MKTQFAIVAEPGSGVDFLMEGVREHPSVRLYDQLFTRSDYPRMERLSQQGVLIKFGEDPLHFLETKILTDHDPDVSAIGFVLLYPHARTVAWRDIWKLVRKKLKVIHFKRKNLLDRFVSNRTPSHVEPSELETAIKHIEALRREHDVYFRQSRTIGVFLEDLCDESLQTWTEIDDFLGLSQIDRNPDIYPDQQVSKKGVMLNYKELKDHFAGKPLGEYFDE